jgi:CDGSH-type Zn-finger protein
VSAAEVKVYPNGPYLVRGDFRVVDETGAEIDPQRATIALCRCGKSRMKPFCDSTHKGAGFSAPTCERALDEGIGS